MPWWVWVLLAIVAFYLIGQWGFRRGKSTLGSFVACKLAVAENFYQNIREDYAAGRLSSGELYQLLNSLASIKQEIRDEAKARGMPNHPSAIAASRRINDVLMSDVGLLIDVRQRQEAIGMPESERRHAWTPALRGDSGANRD